MKIIRNASLVLVFSFLCLANSQQSMAAPGSLSGRVTSILTDTRFYGGCMALFSVDPQSVLAGCGSGYLTMDCKANLPTSVKSENALKFSAAQLAYVSGTTVYVQFVDDKKINGYCFVERIDNR